MSQNGQTVLEYLLLIGVILLAVVYMGTDIKRGLQSVVKVTVDQIGNQANADQDYESDSGYMVNSWSSSNSNSQRKLLEARGVVTTFINDTTQSGSISYTNQGTSE
jgi:uncharacterized protein (UPF0333 family)